MRVSTDPWCVILACVDNFGGGNGLEPVGGLGGAGLLPTLGLPTKAGLWGSAGWKAPSGEGGAGLSSLRGR